MLGIKVNNLADAIGNVKKLEETGLKPELERLEHQNRRAQLINERHKAAFTLSRDKRHQSWWNADQFVREYFQVDFENVLSKRLKERLHSEQRHTKLKQQQLKQIQGQKGKRNRVPVPDASTIVARQQQQKLIKENEALLKKLHDLKFPELKQSLVEQYQRKALRMGKIPAKNIPNVNKDSKLFMDCAERFLKNKPYNVENGEKLTVEEQFAKLKEKALEDDKMTMKKCEAKFDRILNAFERDKKEASGEYNRYYDDYYTESYYF